ncbi:MAG: CBS domain-containing protein [Euryarchaeota archaeon]|nr:CBS domain-containing protein [Euryarchaeota archaeon]
MLRLPTGNEIREKRLELGLTQKEVARRAAISQPLVARIEKGGVDPRMSTLTRVVEVLNEAATEKLPHARDLISGRIAWVTPGDTVRRAIQMMRENGFSQLPVMERGKPVGILSESRLIERVRQMDDPRKLGKQKVSEVMSGPPPTVSLDAHFSTLDNLLVDSPAVLVVDQGRPAGIITGSDILTVV